MKSIQIGTVLVAGALILGLAVPAVAAPPQNLIQGSLGPDDIPHPMGMELRALKKEALEAQLRGGKKGKNGVYKTSKGKYVELTRESEDPIFTVLGQFGDEPSPYFGGEPGPLHNQIAEPDRDYDNVTIWTEDFNRSHYEEMLFSDEEGANSMRNYYIEQSSGRYAVYGDVTEWVTVPYNASHYGNDFCGDVACWNTWWFVEDSLNAWYASQLDSGMTPEDVDAYLSQFDVWDRYDHDGDGDFDEPDGYIDHFQAVHAGEGQEAGGGPQGSDAIWSHRWYVQLTGIGEGGPVLDDGSMVPYGGVQVGQSKYWIGDYTIEPENGGVGVFAHEFAHDLGLPDLYDSGGSNSTGFWSLMSSGSWTSVNKEDIGSKPTHMGAWEKLQLGWLNYDVAYGGEQSDHVLGPAEYNSDVAQALVVVLPDKVVETEIGMPYEGDYYYFSGSGDNLDNMVFGDYTIADGSTLTAWVQYDIEPDWDYAYAFAYDYINEIYYELETNLSTSDDPNGQNLGFGITGASDDWVQLTADLPAAGSYLIGFRYLTDGYVTYPGFKVDAIEITEYPLDGAEAPDTMNLDGFEISDGLLVSTHFNAYVAANRRHYGYDRALKYGPYNFGFLDFDEPDYGPYANWVEHFKYQEGLLINYWDASYSDNNVSQHPGGGLILPIDSHPTPLVRTDGTFEPPRVQSHDSPFGLEKVKDLKLHWQDVKTHYPKQDGVCIFDDNLSYYDERNLWASVIVPNTNTQIRVNTKGKGKGGTLMHVSIGNGSFEHYDTKCKEKKCKGKKCKEKKCKGKKCRD